MSLLPRLAFGLRAWLVSCVLPLALWAGASHAAGTADSNPRIPWENGDMPCWDAAGAYHGIDPWLLYAIARVESRHNPKAINKANSNGTRDIGLMQINSIWLPVLRQHGISEAQLFNGCASTYIGAWIMAKNIRKHGYTWEAIAVYNVGSLNTPGRIKAGRRYAEKVYAAYDDMVRTRSAMARPQG